MSTVQSSDQSMHMTDNNSNASPQSTHNSPPQITDQADEITPQSTSTNTDPDTSEQPPRKRCKLSKKLHIAVAGCSHGEMDKIYASLTEIERRNGYKIDLLISCGDYQAARNTGDLSHMHVNKKYRSLKTFYRYYSGELRAPILTIFIGGNHEASGYLQELPNGGWVAPNIYYMGHANCINFAGIRIAGLSGIFNKHHYHMGHWERPPFDEYGSAVSVYHVRAVDVFRLKQLQPRNDDKSGLIDVMLSHDWPAGITDYGNVDDLLKRKPFFKEDIQKNTLGNPATMCLVHELRPRYWLAAHLHCKFAALIAHSDSTESESNKENVTRFLSLDKPLPRRHFIQILEFDVDEDADLNLSYDPTWLAILKATDSFTDASKRVSYMPSRGHSSVDEMSSDAERCDYRPTKEELDHIDRLFNGHFTIPLNFRQTAPPHSATEPFKHTEFYYRNPQSMEFCSKLGIRDLNEILCAQSANGVGTAFYLMPNDDSKQQDNTSAIQSSCTDSEEFEDGLDFKIDRGRRSSPIRIDSDQLKSE